MLPESPNRIYGTDTPVHPGDLNDIQDAIVAAKHGLVEIPYSAFAWRLNGATAGSFLVTPAQLLTTSNGIVAMDLPGLIGRRVKSVKFSMKGDGAADITEAAVRKVTALGVETTLGGSLVINNEPAAWAVKTIDIPDTSPLTGEALFLTVAFNAGGIAFGNVSVFLDKPS